MTLSDISFIAAFIAFPLLIIVLSIWGLRTLNQRQRQPIARFSSNNPAESTQEMPAAQLEPSRDWAAVIQPTRGSKSEEPASSRTDQTQPFAVPKYRGRSGGVVRRANSNLRRRKPVRPTDDSNSSNSD